MMQLGCDGGACLSRSMPARSVTILFAVFVGSGIFHVRSTPQHQKTSTDAHCSLEIRRRGRALLYRRFVPQASGFEA